MSTRGRAWTLDEYETLPDQDGLRHELVEGLVVSEPRPAFAHGAAQASIAAALHAFVAQRGLGRVVTESGFILARDPDTLRGPDVAFVSGERLEGLAQLAGFFEGAPDLCVEVRSPHDREADMRARVADYLAAGARVVWVAHPERREVTVYRTLLAPRTFAASDVLDGEDVLPGFRIEVGELLGD